MAAEGQTCALPGCTRPPFPSPEPCRPHLACGILHHQLLMAARFHSFHPDSPHRQIADRNAAGLCALISCSKPPHPGCSWCSRSHVLNWLFDFTSSLHDDQICNVSDCARHVFVEKNHSRWKFCGWRHWQKDVMQLALKHRRQKLSLQDQQASSPFLIQGICYHEPTLKSRLRSLRDYAQNGITPLETKVDEDFYQKHPSDICAGGDICWLIVPQKGSRKQKGRRITKDGFHWKQQSGPGRRNSGYTVKYFTHKKLQDKQNNGGCSYHLEEYTIPSVDRFALIMLHKGSARRKRSKAQELPGTSASDETNADDLPSLKHNEMYMESLYYHLLSSPTHVDLEDVLGLNFEC